MKYIYILLVVYVMKLLHDFFAWMYGYYLHYKWVAFFKTKNNKYISYSYQIEKYISAVPNVSIADDLFTSYLYNEHLESFIKSHGYYKFNFFQNFNPYYWIKIVVFLPQKILLYLNPRHKQKTLHIFNVIYWLGTFIFTIYNDEATTFIKNIIDSFLRYFSK